MKSIVTTEEVTNYPWPVSRSIIRADEPVAKTPQNIHIEAIIDAIHEPILILNKDLRIQSANKAFSRNFKMTKRNMPGLNFADLGKPGPQLHKIIRRLK